MANTAAKKITYNNKPVQVESAIRDGTGLEINTNYLKILGGGISKTYELKATGYKTILQMKDAATFWTTNSAIAYVIAKIEYSLVSFGSAATLDAKKAIWIVDAKYTGNDHSIDIKSIGDSVGTGNGILRYFASFAPKNSSYCPQIAVALDNANTKVYIRVTILSASEGWQCPSTIGGDPGTTNYNRWYVEAGRYNYTWSSNKIAANITGSCDGTAGTAWDSFRNDRYLFGESAVAGSIMAKASDGRMYKLRNGANKEFTLPLHLGRCTGTFTYNGSVSPPTLTNYAQIMWNARGVAYTELTNTSMQTTAFTVPTLTSNDFGKTLYITGTLLSNGNFKPDGNITLAMVNDKTNIPIGRIDRANVALNTVPTQFTITGYSQTAYTLDSNGILTHIDGKEIKDTTYSSLTAASSGTAVSLVTTGEKYTWNNKSNLAIGTTASTAAAGNHTHGNINNDGTLGTASRAVVTDGNKKITTSNYTLGDACAKAVTDSSSASAIGTGTSLPTERDIYYGLPTINGVHNYTSSTSIYAPTTGGTNGQVLYANGSTFTPTWTNPSSLSVGYATYAGDLRKFRYTGSIGITNSALCAVDTTGTVFRLLESGKKFPLPIRFTTPYTTTTAVGYIQSRDYYYTAMSYGNLSDSSIQGGSGFTCPTLAASNGGQPLYVRGSLDTVNNVPVFVPDGNITLTMAPGYTYIPFGEVFKATASGAPTQFYWSFENATAYTLDANGKLTHIDGKPLSNNDPSVLYRATIDDNQALYSVWGERMLTCTPRGTYDDSYFEPFVNGVQVLRTGLYVISLGIGFRGGDGSAQQMIGMIRHNRDGTTLNVQNFRTYCMQYDSDGNSTMLVYAEAGDDFIPSINGTTTNVYTYFQTDESYFNVIYVGGSSRGGENITISSSAPSGGSNGDIWIQY